MYKNFIRPILFKFDAERTHDFAIRLIKNNLLIYPKIKNYDSLKNNICNIEFNNPIIMAAGFDKNAAIILNLFKFGFGSVECGTVTPKAQIGTSNNCN